MSGSIHRSAGLLWLRVALLVAGVAAGLWLSFTPAPGLYQVRPRSVGAVRRIQAEAAATQPAAVEMRTVQGNQAWQELAAQIADTVKGTSKALLPNLNTALGENDFYFPPAQPAMQQIAPGGGPHYVEVAPGGQAGYLEVNFLQRGVGLRHVPTHLAYPLRRYAVWCFVVGIAAFVLLPHSYYRFPSLRAAEVAVGITLAGGMAVIWLLPANLSRPLVEKRPEISVETVAWQEQIAKELDALQEEMQKALPELDKGSLAERKAKLDAYKALVARKAKLSQEFMEGDAGGAEPAATQPTP